jgi:hypothetical protein
VGIALKRWLARLRPGTDRAPVARTAQRVLMTMSGLHFIEADLREDWLGSIDWDAVVGSILIRGGWSQ